MIKKLILLATEIIAISTTPISASLRKSAKQGKPTYNFDAPRKASSRLKVKKRNGPIKNPPPKVTREEKITVGMTVGGFCLGACCGALNMMINQENDYALGTLGGSMIGLTGGLACGLCITNYCICKKKKNK